MRFQEIYQYIANLSAIFLKNRSFKIFAVFHVASRRHTIHLQYIVNIYLNFQTWLKISTLLKKSFERDRRDVFSIQCHYSLINKCNEAFQFIKNKFWHSKKHKTP